MMTVPACSHVHGRSDVRDGLSIGVRYRLSVVSSTSIELSTGRRIEVLKALADPVRVEILDLLSPLIRCNCQLQEQLDLAPSLLSYHLKILREAGLVEGSRRGRWVDYSLSPDAADLIAAALPRGLWQ
jgi:ArsR family transcriptional regulator